MAGLAVVLMLTIIGVPEGGMMNGLWLVLRGLLMLLCILITIWAIFGLIRSNTCLCY